MKYKSVPAPMVMVVERGKNACYQTIASYGELINREAVGGWELDSIKEIPVMEKAGCIKSLFGAKQKTTTFKVLIFRLDDGQPEINTSIESVLATPAPEMTEEERLELERKEQERKAEEEKRKAEEQARIAEEQARLAAERAEAERIKAEKKKAQQEKMKALVKKLTVPVSIGVAAIILIIAGVAVAKNVIVPNARYSKSIKTANAAVDKKSIELADIPGRGIKMMKTEVTEGLFIAVMGESQKTMIQDYTVPVTGVTAYDAFVFCNKLSERYGLNPVYSYNGKTNPSDWENDYVPKSGQAFNGEFEINSSANGFRLPSLKERKVAAAGGNKDLPFAGSKECKETCWFAENTTVLMPVGKLKANGYGLYDMCGNAYELTAEMKKGKVVVKYAGGCYNDSETSSLSWDSAWETTDNYQSRYIGFRVVCQNPNETVANVEVEGIVQLKSAKSSVVLEKNDYKSTVNYTFFNPSEDLDFTVRFPVAENSDVTCKVGGKEVSVSDGEVDVSFAGGKETTVVLECTSKYEKDAKKFVVTLNNNFDGLFDVAEEKVSLTIVNNIEEMRPASVSADDKDVSKSFERKGERFVADLGKIDVIKIVVADILDDVGPEKFPAHFKWSSKKITDADMFWYNKAQLRVLRNSLYALHGYTFKSDDLRAYFTRVGKTWETPYEADPNYSESRLNDYEAQNIRIIKAAENSR